MTKMKTFFVVKEKLKRLDTRYRDAYFITRFVSKLLEEKGYRWFVNYIHLYSPSNGSNTHTIKKQRIIKQG